APGLFVNTAIRNRRPIHSSASSIPGYGRGLTNRCAQCCSRIRSRASGVSGSREAAVSARRTSTPAPSPTMLMIAASGRAGRPRSAMSALTPLARSTPESTSVPSRSKTMSGGSIIQHRQRQTCGQSGFENPRVYPLAGYHRAGGGGDMGERRGRLWRRAAAVAILTAAAAGATGGQSGRRADANELRSAYDNYRAQQQSSAYAAFKWQYLGPINLSGRATDIAVAERGSSRRIYAGYASSGVWQSDDYGATWQPIFDNYPS